MGVLLGLKPSQLVAFPKPVREYKLFKGIDEERYRQIVKLEKIHKGLEEMHEEVSEGDQRRRTQAQKTHNARTSMLPIYIGISDYAMIGTHVKRSHKLQSIWCGPVKVISSKSNLVFAVEDIVIHYKLRLHAKRVTPNPVARIDKRALDELKKPTVHYDVSYHLVNAIRSVRKRRGAYEMLVNWLRFEEGEDEPWEPLEQAMRNMPEILEDFLYSRGNRNLKKDNFGLIFLIKNSIYRRMLGAL